MITIAVCVLISLLCLLVGFLVGFYFTIRVAADVVGFSYEKMKSLVKEYADENNRVDLGEL